MVGGTQASCRADKFKLTSSTVIYKIATIVSGDSLTIRSDATGTDYVLIDSTQANVESNGYKLSAGQSLTLMLSRNDYDPKYVEIWVKGSADNIELSMFRLSDKSPHVVYAT